ncbi:hypothetical protein GCM10007190_06360 [Macrococcus hajekii]|nr:hypothetical protein GCM10007190_06360 [Macrococcus hajekii]
MGKRKRIAQYVSSYIRREKLFLITHWSYISKGTAFSINEAFEWCEQISKRSLSRLLNEEFESSGQSKATVYYRSNK